MNLRRQLLLVATVALALPWAGCQYVKEMDRVLRLGQIDSLQATSQALASRITSDSQLYSSVVKPIQWLSLESPKSALYAQPLMGEVSLDGYSDDWSYLDSYSRLITSDRFPEDSLFHFSLGQKGDYLYLFVVVNDSDRQFYNPLRGASKSDHLMMGLGLDSGLLQLQVFSAASGSAVVEVKGEGGEWRREHRVAAVWNEEADFYSVELRLPLAWAERGLSVQAWDGTSVGAVPIITHSDLRSLVIPKVFYDDVLNVFVRPGVKLYLTLPGGWILGQSGSVRQGVVPTGGVAWMHWMIRWVVGQEDYPDMGAGAAALGGQLLGAEFEVANTGERARQWYVDGSRMVARVITPVVLPSGRVVSVVAEESTDSVEQLTTGAIGRLLLYSLIATGVVAAALLLYASYLSFRVRRLSHDVHRAVDSDGRVGEVFVSSKSADEIGDLSRSYSTLLQRVRSYNQYLEGLSSKLSHELRTPLAIVSSSLDNLQHCSIGGDAQAYVDRASDGTQRLSSILNSMAAASKLEQSIQLNETEVVDVAEIIDQVVVAYREIYSPCQLELDIRTSRPLIVSVAPELLVQMLDKLVENAVDFAGPSGCVYVELELLESHAFIRVINNGPLLPKGFQGQIFDSMVSVREGELKAAKGGGHHLGLGLYIVRLIAQFHGGDVQAFNHADGDKVVFEVSIPIDFHRN